MNNLIGKKLLVLGGTSASVEVVNEAHKLGIYVIVADQEQTGIAKELADESYVISTTDFTKLHDLILAKKIDGVFCGPSEFNLVNVRKLCTLASLPHYCTTEQWDICSNKASFKELCRKFKVPCVPEYHLTKDLLRSDLDRIQYPVLVKPVDGCSSKGLSVCQNEQELLLAIPLALNFSESKQFIVEKYITNDQGFGCRYIACNGEIFLTATNDRYTVDKAGGKAMISSVALFPSTKITSFIENINPNIISMFKSLDIQNGSFFMQALIDDDGKIYFHEMGLRLSGGLIYKMFEQTCGFSDMQMMLRYAVGEPFASISELQKIDPYFNGKYTGSLCIPLNPGQIKQISGLDKILSDPSILDLSQYYYEGDIIEESQIGTLMQHFCRIKLLTNSKEEFISKINWIQHILSIIDSNGNDLIYKYFDTERLK